MSTESSSVEATKKRRIVESDSVSSISSFDHMGHLDATIKDDVVLKGADEMSSEMNFDFNPLLGIVHGSAWLWTTVILVIISVFLMDFSFIFLGQDEDVVVNVIYIIIAFVFFVEFMVLMIFQPGYFACGNERKVCGCSMFFWADFLALLSMIPDCIPTDALANVPENTSNFPFLIYASLRIFRLFRLWRFFKLLGLFNIYETKIDRGYAHRLGKTYVTYSSMKIGFVILVLCFVLSILSYDVVYVGPYMAAELIEGFEEGSPMFQDALNTFTETYPVLQYTLDGVDIFIEEGEEIQFYRDIELETFTTARSTIIMDASELIQGESILFIFKYLILIVVFLIVVFVVDYDIKVNFTKVFREIITRTVKVAKALGTYKATDELYLNPFGFYDSMLHRMINLTNDDGEEESTVSSSSSNISLEASVNVPTATTSSSN